MRNRMNAEAIRPTPPLLLKKLQLVSLYSVYHDKVQGQARRINAGGVTLANPTTGTIELCIDGRRKNTPSPEQQPNLVEDRIHFPGGVFPLYVAVQQLTRLPAEETIAFVNNTLGQRPWIHTDDHSGMEGVGCAMAKTLMSEERRLGNDPFIAQQLWALTLNNPEKQMDVYFDAHQEVTGKILHTENVTIRSPHEKGQDFVYDRLRAREWTRSFAERLNEELVRNSQQAVAFDTLWKTLDTYALQAMNLLVIEAKKPLEIISDGSKWGTLRRTVIDNIAAVPAMA